MCQDGKFQSARKISSLWVLATTKLRKVALINLLSKAQNHYSTWLGTQISNPWLRRSLWLQDQVVTTKFRWVSSGSSEVTICSLRSHELFCLNIFNILKIYLRIMSCRTCRSLCFECGRCCWGQSLSWSLWFRPHWLRGCNRSTRA